MSPLYPEIIQLFLRFRRLFDYHQSRSARD